MRVWPSRWGDIPRLALQAVLVLFACDMSLHVHVLLRRYAVFGLGSSMYPRFCAFAHDIDIKLSQLGASQLTPVGEGDELSGQEDAFCTWAVQTFQVSFQLERPTALMTSNPSGMTSNPVCGYYPRHGPWLEARGAQIQTVLPNTWGRFSLEKVTEKPPCPQGVSGSRSFPVDI